MNGTSPAEDSKVSPKKVVNSENSKLGEYIRSLEIITKFIKGNSKSEIRQIWSAQYPSFEEEDLDFSDIKHYCQMLINLNSDVLIALVKQSQKRDGSVQQFEPGQIEKLQKTIDKLGNLSNTLLSIYIEEKDSNNQFALGETLAILQKYVSDDILRDYKGAYKISFHGAKLLESSLGLTEMKKTPENLDLFRRLLYMKGVSCLCGDFIEKERERYEKALQYFMACYKIVSENFTNAEPELQKINKMISKCNQKISNCLNKANSAGPIERSPRKLQREKRVGTNSVSKSHNMFKIRKSSDSKISKDSRLPTQHSDVGADRGLHRRTKSQIALRQSMINSVAPTLTGTSKNQNSDPLRRSIPIPLGPRKGSIIRLSKNNSKNLSEDSRNDNRKSTESGSFNQEPKNYSLDLQEQKTMKSYETSGFNSSQGSNKNKDVSRQGQLLSENRSQPLQTQESPNQIVKGTVLNQRYNSEIYKPSKHSKDNQQLLLSQIIDNFNPSNQGDLTPQSLKQEGLSKGMNFQQIHDVRTQPNIRKTSEKYQAKPVPAIGVNPPKPVPKLVINDVALKRSEKLASNPTNKNLLGWNPQTDYNPLDFRSNTPIPPIQNQLIDQSNIRRDDNTFDSQHDKRHQDFSPSDLQRDQSDLEAMERSFDKDHSISAIDSKTIAQQIEQILSKEYNERFQLLDEKLRELQEMQRSALQNDQNQMMFQLFSQAIRDVWMAQTQMPAMRNGPQQVPNFQMYSQDPKMMQYHPMVAGNQQIPIPTSPYHGAFNQHAAVSQNQLLTNQVGSQGKIYIGGGQGNQNNQRKYTNSHPSQVSLTENKVPEPRKKSVFVYQSTNNTNQQTSMKEFKKMSSIKTPKKPEKQKNHFLDKSRTNSIIDVVDSSQMDTNHTNQQKQKGEVSQKNMDSIKSGYSQLKDGNKFRSSKFSQYVSHSKLQSDDKLDISPSSNSNINQTLISPINGPLQADKTQKLDTVPDLQFDDSRSQSLDIDQSIANMEQDLNQLVHNGGPQEQNTSNDLLIDTQSQVQSMNAKLLNDSEDLEDQEDQDYGKDAREDGSEGSDDVQGSDEDEEENSQMIQKYPITESYLELCIGSEPLPKQEIGLLHYKNRSLDRLIPRSRLIFLKDYKVDLQKIMYDFKIGFEGRKMVFNKQIMVGEIVYTIILQISCKNGEFQFVLDPTIDEMMSHQIEAKEYNFKRELLDEMDFIRLISDIAIVDKLLPIDSFYTIGTFIEFIEKLLMPSLIIQNDKMVTLEVWPYSMDMIHDCETGMNGSCSTHWYYHMYDNNIVLFIHMQDHQDDEDDEEDDGMGYDSPGNQNIRIDINVAAITFNTFFIHIEEKVTNNIEQHLDEIDQIISKHEKSISGVQKRIETEKDHKVLLQLKKELENVSKDQIAEKELVQEYLANVKENISLLMKHKRVYKMNNQVPVLEESQISLGETERSHEGPPLRKQILNRFTHNLIQQIEQSYSRIGIEFFEEQVAQDTNRGSLKSYYLTQVFVKT